MFGHVCPNCGYCPHCGRGGYGRPWRPFPYQPGPIWQVPMTPQITINVPPTTGDPVAVARSFLQA